MIKEDQQYYDNNNKPNLSAFPDLARTSKDENGKYGPFQQWLIDNKPHQTHYRAWKKESPTPNAATDVPMIQQYFNQNLDKYSEFIKWYGNNKSTSANKYKDNLRFLPRKSEAEKNNNEDYFLLNYFTGSNPEFKKAYDAFYTKTYKGASRVPYNAEVIHRFLRLNPEFVDPFVNITQKVNSLSPVMQKWIKGNVGKSEVDAFLAWLTNVDPSSITESVIFENDKAHEEDPVFKAFKKSQGGTNSNTESPKVTSKQQKKIVDYILNTYPEFKKRYYDHLARQNKETTTESRFFSKRKINEQIFTPPFSKFAKTLVKTSPALAQQLQQAATRAVQNVFGDEADAATIVDQEFQNLDSPFNQADSSTVAIATGNNTNFAATTNDKDGEPNDDNSDPSADLEDGPFGKVDKSTQAAAGNNTDTSSSGTDDGKVNDTGEEPTVPDQPGVLGRVGNFVNDVASDARNLAGTAAGAVGNLAGDAVDAAGNLLNRRPKPQAAQGQAGTADPQNDVLPGEPTGTGTPYGNEFDASTSNAAAMAAGQQGAAAAQLNPNAAAMAAGQQGAAAQGGGGGGATTPAQTTQKPAAVQKPKPAAQSQYYPNVKEPDYNKSLRIAQNTLKKAQQQLSQGNVSNLDKMQAQTDVQRQNQLIKMYQTHLLANPRTAKGKLIHHRNMLNRSAVAAGQAGDQAARQKFKQEAAKIDAQIRNMKESKLIDLQSYINKL